MKTIRIIAKVTSYITFILGFLYLLTSLYTLVAFIFSNKMLHINEDVFSINYPFSSVTFLLGDNNIAYKIHMFAMIFLYGLFFMLLHRVFMAFQLKRLFTLRGINALWYFSVANLTLPILVFIFYSAFVETIDNEFILVILHAIMGIFALFLKAIFKEGLNLQNDQDLTI